MLVDYIVKYRDLIYVILGILPPPSKHYYGNIKHAYVCVFSPLH